MRYNRRAATVAEARREKPGERRDASYRTNLPNLGSGGPAAVDPAAIGEHHRLEADVGPDGGRLLLVLPRSPDRRLCGVALDGFSPWRGAEHRRRRFRFSLNVVCAYTSA